MRKLLILTAFLPVILSAQCTSTLVSSGTYGTAQGASGKAQYVVYLPEPAATCFKGDILLFAHGYIPVGAPSGAWLTQLALPNGTSLPTLVNNLGFGFAASSFSKDGLAILQGFQDTQALTNVIAALPIPVHKYFATGASEGGLIAAKLVEQSPTFDGGVAVCGPVGDFQKQIDYFGDVRVLFDYFFPGILTSAGGSAINIPPGLMAGWMNFYEPIVKKAITSNPLATLQLLSTANIAIGLNFSNAADAITGALWYNVFATNDAHATLGGNPYDNIGRVYHGSFNDARLNASVARFAADPAAVAQLQKYETTGLLKEPLVTLHTLADPIVPFAQEPLYAAKVAARGSSSELTEIPALSYGHCNVSAADAEGALLLLLIKAGI
ncbi:MAG TPA: hypothetical protein VH639_13645 [Bryobacteraceae bacterium]|jgi:hypothetical protein